jgi:DNA-binding HxlR family transcriptional regulator
MRLADVGDLTCSVARTLSVVGDRWTLLVLRDAFLGVRRFEDFQAVGLTRHRLADRLNRLVEAGVMDRVRYQDRPQRFEYRLTEKGHDLYPIIVSMTRWGDRWMAGDAGAPIGWPPSLRSHGDAGARLPAAEPVTAHMRAVPVRRSAAPDDEQEGDLVMQTQSVDPSVSRSPLPLEADDVATPCVLCSHNCGLRVDIRGGEIVEVRADEHNPITEGYVCNKAFSIAAYVQHAQRTRHPLRRRADGTFERISWDTAITEIATKLRDVRDRHSPRAIALVGIGGQGNHMDGAYGVGFLRSLGSRRWFNAFAQEKTQHNLLDQWMFAASPAAFFHPDAEHSQFLLVMGTNPKISNRGHNATDTLKRFLDEPGRTLVVVDPRETETTRGAHRHLRVRPGTDVYLLLALAAVIVRENLIDEQFVAEHTTGLDAVRQAFDGVDVAEMARRCGLGVEEIEATARGFASAGSAAIFFDLGVEQAPFSTLISYLIRLSSADRQRRQSRRRRLPEMLPPPVVDPSLIKEPERARVGHPGDPRAGERRLTLVPRRSIDTPNASAPSSSRAQPLLSYSDSQRWRGARAARPAGRDRPGHDGDRRAGGLRAARRAATRSGVHHLPKRYPNPHPGASAARARQPRRCRSRRSTCASPRRSTCSDRSRRSCTTWPRMREPDGAAAYMMAGSSSPPATRRGSSSGATVPSVTPARTVLSAIWLLCGLNALPLRAVLRTLGPDWEGRSPFEGPPSSSTHPRAPGGVEVARQRVETNFPTT